MVSESISSNDELKRTVSFDKISIRNYERAIVDHPAVSSGPGLSISWHYTERSHQSVDEFELSRSGTRKLSHVDLVVSREERERILREECGYARSEIAQCVRSVNVTKHNRRQTINNLSMQTCEETWQSVMRGVRRCCGMENNSEKEIKELWKAAEESQPKINEMDRSSVSTIRSSLKKIDVETHRPKRKHKPKLPQTASTSASLSSVISDITTVTTKTRSTLSNPNLGTGTLSSRPKSILKPRNIIAEEEGDW